MRGFAWIIFTLSVMLAGCAHELARGATSADNGTLRVMTYNIRLDLASDGADAWPNRRGLVFDLIRHEAPAVMGMQEVLIGQKSDLEMALPAYAFAGVGRDDGAEKGEFSPVAWRRDRFQSLGSGTFWLSPTPDVPGKGWDASYPRIATWVLLRNVDNGRRVRVLNTHFDHVGVVAREMSGKLIAKWAKSRVADGERVILMGDFNSTPDMPAIVTLANETKSSLRDAREISRTRPYGPSGTFNGFQIDRDDPAPIDHIFVSNGFAVASVATVTQHWGGRLPSDHYPVVVDLETLD